MPFDIALNEAKRIVMSRAWGELTDHDLLSHLQYVTDAFAQGILDQSWGHIADFSKVENLGRVSSQVVQELAERNPWPSESPRVLIVPSDEQYGLARMYQIFGEPKTESLVLVRTAAEANEYMQNVRSGLTEAI